MTLCPRPSLYPLPYLGDGTFYFDSIHATLPAAVILQSNAQAETDRNRYDIISADPCFTLTRHAGQLALTGRTDKLAGWQPSPSQHDSFQALSELAQQILAWPADYSECEAAGLPFCGGLIGYCSYDLARETRALPGHAQADIDLPLMQFSFFGWACIQDHQKQAAWLVIHPACRDTLAGRLLAWRASLAASTVHSNAVLDAPATAEALQHELSREAYFDAIRHIQDYILAGDCYQINYAQRISMRTRSAPQALYHTLRHATPSPYCTYLPVLGTGATILSFSPERFLHLSPDRTVTTQPIKGTCPRGQTPQEDAALASALQADSKNRAENIMIVDLLRNDLGQVCETGSVQVTALCELQTFANVHHLVSTIQGRLLPHCNGADLLRACFPGGSITGAPKLRAMQIIDELEPTRRSIYCGSVAYFSCHGAMDSNILIRTLLHLPAAPGEPDRLYCWGGGGIVADSEASREYDESLTKIGALLRALQR